MKYLVKIFTEEVQTEITLESAKEINDEKDLHPLIIDYLGKNDIKWEPNPLQFSGGYYITYEEVDDGSGQHGIVREETETRV